ncbi:DUF4173 domain-containing protein [candidate division KSB1 bacterium]|nr:DUF4173 domain-containing protein [candidate division KSB1 bacterium]
MNTRTNLAFAALVAALVLGMLGDALLRVIPWGLNMCLWILTLVAVVAVITCQTSADTINRVWWMALPVIFCAAAFIWRDSSTLKILNVLALFILLALTRRMMKAGQIRIAGVAEFAQEFAFSIYNTVAGLVYSLFNDIQWQEIAGKGWSKPAVGIGRGLLLASPLLLIFSILFMAADAVFADMVNLTFRQFFDDFFSHLFWAAFYTWIAGGVIHDLFLEEKKENHGDTRPSSLSLGIIEVSTMLSLLNVLFLVFVIVQFRYFFGGDALVEVAPNLTYAEYARRGFFELVTISALVLPLLLVLHWLLRKENPKHEHLFRALAGAQILMLFVIMASAVQRMRLYQNEYGLTELRLYTTAFMGWLAIVFIWFAITVLRGRRERFAFGALVAGFFVYIALVGLNPDAFIARVNIDRAKAGQRFDLHYAASLSDDAVPELIAALPDLNEHRRYYIASHLLKRLQSFNRQDWRSWGWTRAKARRLIQEQDGYLHEAVSQYLSQ